MVGYGKFIVFEGLDASGKSSLLKYSSKFLEDSSYSVLMTKEPSESPVGLFLRKILKGESNLNSYFGIQLLFWADRAEHIASEVKPAVEKGINVLSDRYMYSTLAYGAASGLTKDQLDAFYRLSESFMKPDAVFYLNVSVQTAIHRIETRGEKKELFEKSGVLEKVREEYLKMSKKFGFINIDAEKPLEQIKPVLSSELEKIFSR